MPGLGAVGRNDDGTAVREQQALGTDGRPSALVTSPKYAVLLGEIAALKALVQGTRVQALSSGNSSSSSSEGPHEGEAPLPPLP
ncbi:hypothetical protein CYMTET_56525 [Cymbomonas tetramitiformis]|uniref:Uncharacterized protein n=1 Tax=Cymbomonas tetramitiformis TaxID=36881 RepID=A0AAE0BB44_9CHLO|nr:hypothetical protein CYMTET_56525 [Cymbomonas tetramitiformis]